MPRTCTVCRHPSRQEIDEALTRGEAYRGIAVRHGIPPSNVDRHRVHVVEKLAKAKEVQDVVEADTLLDRLKSIMEQTREILAEARAAKDQDVALKALTRLERQLELEAKLLGQIREASINIMAVDPVALLRTAYQAAAERRRSLA